MKQTKTPFECYRAYLGFKNHLNGKLDYFKYRGRTNVSPEAFENRNDRFAFHTISKHKDPYMFILGNLLVNYHGFVGDFKERPYQRLIRVTSDLNGTFERQLDIIGDIHEAIEFKNKKSMLLNLYLSGKVDIEVLTILNSMFNCVEYWKTCTNSFIYDDVFMIVPNYASFIDYDIATFKKIVINKNRENALLSKCELQIN